MADTAQFGVEIPPVKGGEEAAKTFDKLTQSAERAAVALDKVGQKHIAAGASASQAVGGMSQMQGAASQLLMTMGPLGQRAAMLQTQLGGVGNAFKMLGGLSAGVVAGIGLAVAALLALAAAVMAVKKAFDILGDAVSTAARFQMLSDMFADFIGDAKQAAVEMEKLRKLWHEAGVFKLDDIVDAATRLRSLGANTEHVAELTEALGKAALAGTGDIKAMADALASLMAGRIRGAPTLDQLTLVRAIAIQAKQPMETLDAAISRTMLSIKKHEVATEDMAQALIKAGQAGGTFADEIKDEQQLFEGATKVMKQRYEEFLKALGEPIIDKLTPIILRWSERMGLLIPKGTEWGEAIAIGIGKIDDAIEQGKFGELMQNMFKAAVEAVNAYLEKKFQDLWHVTLYELPKKEWETFSTWFQKANEVTWAQVGTFLKNDWNSMWAEFMDGWGKVFRWLQEQASHIRFSPTGGVTWAPGAPGQAPVTPLPAPPGTFQNVPLPAQEPGIPTPVEPGAMPGGTLGNWIKTHEDKTSGKESDWEKYKTDLALMNDYWEEYAIIQSKAVGETEKQFRQMEALDKLIPTLADPTAHLAELMKGLGPSDAAIVKWKVLNEVAQRTLKNIEMKAKANQATMGEIWHAGLQRMTDSWGSFQEQMISGIGEIGNALVSDISSGLVDILDGTKSVSEGFRDMALSIVKDIERIVVKMLVQLAIQQLIAAFGGTTTYGAGSSTSQALGPLLESSTANMQRGGSVPGSGRGDKVPALLEPGEYVIPKDSAERIGYGQLEAIRHMAGGGVVRMATGGAPPRPGGQMLNPGQYPTASIGPNSPFHPGQVVNVPGIGPVFIGDYGPGVPGLDIPVTNASDMRSDLLNRVVMINGRPVQITGFIPSQFDPGNKDPKGGGQLGYYTNKPIQPWTRGGGGGGGGGRTLPPGKDPFGRPRAGGRQGGPGDLGTDYPRFMGFPESPGGGVGFPLGPGGYGGGYNLGPGASGNRPGFFDFNAPGSIIVPRDYTGTGGGASPWGTDPGAFTGEAPGMILAPNGTTYAPTPGGYMIVNGPGQGTVVTSVPHGSTPIRGLTSPITGQPGTGNQPIYYDPRGGMGGVGDRMGMGDPFSPGAYNPAGPGGVPGTFGTNFGSGTVGTRAGFSTAIGFSGNFGGGSYARPSALGGGHWMRTPGAVMRGLFHDPATDKYPAPDLVRAFTRNAGFMRSQGFGPTVMAGGNFGGTGTSVGQYWANVFRTRGFIFHPQTGGSADTGGGVARQVQAGSGGGRPKTFHEGGIVDTWAEYQSGGTVQRGEGVFTPEQMASMQPAGGGTQVNQITIGITNQGGRVDGKMEGSGLNDRDAREMARAMLAICKAQIEKEKRSGGSLYLSRQQRGG